MQARERIIVALDVDSPDKALTLVEQLSPHVGSFKLGLELITAMFLALVTAPTLGEAVNVLEKIRKLFTLVMKQVFYDGKFKDIPNTIAGASKAVSKAGVRMFNVHADSGIAGMKAAVANRGNSDVLAVSVLTSIDENNGPLIFGRTVASQVLQMARMAKDAKCQGLICSPQELKMLSEQEDVWELPKTTPGIRSSEDAPDDQRRTMSAKEAIGWGAKDLVIGRPITAKTSPVEAAQRIAAEIEQGLKDRLDRSLFDLQKIKFGAFKLKLHEKQPDAPLSPIYLNIRELPDWVYNLCGDIVHDLVTREGLEFDYVIGIPKAGEPIGQAVAKATGKPHLRIKKVEDATGRHISTEMLDHFESGKRVLLVDDLITKADTKLEAIASVEANGLKVAGIVVLYDREQGGIQALTEKGVRACASRRLSDALQFYVDQQKIKASKREEVLEYIKLN